MKHFIFTGHTKQDVANLTKMQLLAANEDYAQPSEAVMLQLKGRNQFDWKMACRIQATLLDCSNPKNMNPGIRTNATPSSRTHPVYVAELIPTMFPIAIFYKDSKNYRLRYGQTGKGRSAPVMDVVVEKHMVRQHLHEWYKGVVSIAPLSCLNEYVFGIIAATLYASIEIQ